MTVGISDQGRPPEEGGRSFAYHDDRDRQKPYQPGRECLVVKRSLPRFSRQEKTDKPSKGASLVVSSKSGW